jgi:transaldolase
MGLTKGKLKVNMTFVFSKIIFRAAQAGTTHTSPFAGRLIKIGHDGNVKVNGVAAMFGISEMGPRSLPRRSAIHSI